MLDKPMLDKPPIRKKNSVKETVQVSVILATHNQADNLKRFLEAMTDLPSEPEWELIIVNCSSTDDTGRLLTEQLQKADFQLNVITSGLPSLSHARNMALKYAKGSLIVFADDNVIPDAFWLQKFYETSQQYPKAQIFGGRVFLDTAQLPKWLTQSPGLRKLLTKEHDLGNKYTAYKWNEYPSGACVALRRTALKSERVDKHELTPWPTLLGPGTRNPIGEDLAFLTLLSEPEAKTRVYVPDATVTKKLDHTVLIRPFKAAYGYGKVRGQLNAIFKIDAAQSKATSPLNDSTGLLGWRCRLHQAVGMKIGKLTFRNRHQLWPL